MPSVSTRPRRIPSQVRGERRVAELLEAAEVVIAEAGYEAATMSAIAERAGASIGSLYQFFPCKPAITQALRVDYAKQFNRMCEPLAEQAKSLTLDDLVDRLIDLTIEFIESHPAFPALLDTPRRLRPSPVIRNQLREQMAGIFRAREPRLSKSETIRLATVTLQIMKALNHLYTELAPKQRRAFIQEFKMVLHSYLSTRLEPHAAERRSAK